MVNTCNSVGKIMRNYIVKEKYFLTDPESDDLIWLTECPSEHR